jgi:hypothetical protein
MSELSLIGQVVTEALEKFPNTSSLCLARIIYRDNVALFINVEHARSALRYYRGANGNKDRNSLVNKKYIRKFQTIDHGS